MIDSYFVNTPNGRKVSIMLAETALPHRLIRGDRGEVDHLSKAFRKINPNARLPAIVITHHWAAVSRSPCSNPARS